MPAKNKVVSSPTELQIALDNRAFEIQLFWQRSNYFLVLITALGIGVFTIKEPEFAFLISSAATISSVYWFQTNLGSRYWQESWEVEVINLANELEIRSFQRDGKEIATQVKSSLENSAKENSTVFRRWVNRQVLKKPSVSYHMILLSLASIVLWTLVSTMFLWKIRMRFIDVWFVVSEMISIDIPEFTKDIPVF